jgi:hypothetical protein
MSRSLEEEEEYIPLLIMTIKTQDMRAEKYERRKGK